ncbi:translational GTPase TypA [Patescibacteria group bacterium]|jgi:GTP-binding protein|nr:translational GTPase TypA [Patescibacteria group bacterium]
MDIRTIAIIAHVDHGKTTLTDALMRQTGVADETTTMDSTALEGERGITIYSKNTAVFYQDTKINIVDTPGHADFGSEVERVLRSTDSVLLLVDAQEGPMPQTRFVLKKSLALGLRPILVINKVDKPAADPDRVHDAVFDLFAELGATNEQLDFPTIYAIGRAGKAALTAEGVAEAPDLTALLDLILAHVPAAAGCPTAPLRAQAFNLAYDTYTGRLAIVRVYEGTLRTGDRVTLLTDDGAPTSGKVTKLHTFRGVERVEASEVVAGDIAVVAGLPEVCIGDTIAHDAAVEPLSRIAVDEPTIELMFLVNSSPFAGREGQFVTSRQIRERLERELEVNVGLRVDFASDTGDRFLVKGRGELHIAILLETMRREGYEVMVSQPHVIFREVDGVTHEPFEEVTIDAPESAQGTIIETLGTRGCQMTDLTLTDGRVHLTFEGPTRGLFGYRSEFVIDTRGEGIIATRVLGYRPHAGPIEHRTAGSMISQATGKALAFALQNLQTRGTLYIAENTEVYEGMVIGNTAKGEQMTVNPLKGKQLTNMRASGKDEAVVLTPPHLLTIERGLELMADDEYLEVTPASVRLRKVHLRESERGKARRQKD